LWITVITNCAVLVARRSGSPLIEKRSLFPLLT